MEGGAERRACLLRNIGTIAAKPKALIFESVYVFSISPIVRCKMSEKRGPFFQNVFERRYYS